MANENPFPESLQKAYLRRYHLKLLVEFRKSIGRNLNYFGLPSAEMLDISIWKSVLEHIVAIERDIETARILARTAMKLQVRSKTIIIARDLAETLKLIELTNVEARYINTEEQLSPADRNSIIQASSFPYDVVNIDLCGGFLHPTGESSKNLELISSLVNIQKRYLSPFYLIITFSLRDTGGDHYDTFIKDVLESFARQGHNTDELEEFYLTDTEYQDQPKNLRRLRFCVPTYIHKVAYDYYEVLLKGAWSYKTFYHTVLQFIPRYRTSVLGTWPPLNETIGLINAPLYRLEPTNSEEVNSYELVAPFLPSV